MSIDVLTVGVGFFTFTIFLLIHLISFRWVESKHLLKSLLVCVLALMGLPVLLMGVFYIFKQADVSPLTWGCAAILAVAIYGLLCFFYVLCIFGPYETSVRMRLVREIGLAPREGITKKDLLERYSVETIVSIRLQRLVGAGDIIEKDGWYKIGNHKNTFFIFDAIAGVIKKWIGR